MKSSSTPSPFSRTRALAILFLGRSCGATLAKGEIKSLSMGIFGTPSTGTEGEPEKRGSKGGEAGVLRLLLVLVIVIVIVIVTPGRGLSIMITIMITITSIRSTAPGGRWAGPAGRRSSRA